MGVLRTLHVWDLVCLGKLFMGLLKRAVASRTMVPCLCDLFRGPDKEGRSLQDYGLL